MPIQFNLFITTTPATGIADLNLQDEHGRQLAFHQTDLMAIELNVRRSMFDLRNYLDRYICVSAHAATVADIGVAIAEQLLGTAIFELLAVGQHRRTLCVHLPAVSQTENNWVAALARVPWEIARSTPQSPRLGDTNLLVRINHTIAHPPSSPIPLEPDEALRVLFIFAEARGSRPLSARRERRELLRLFKQEIYPRRRIVAHFLTHGVTRAQLVDQIQQYSGYHIVHWSGHGSLNVLDLASPGGANDAITGDELVMLFHEAGGFLPRLMFLSACQSGDSLRARDWQDFFSIVQGQQRRLMNTEDQQVEAPAPTVSGTAYALLNSGVPSVIAMRYAVGDDYARDLALKFYGALLADAAPKNASAALNLARKNLAARPDKGAVFSITDHVTAMLYGAEDAGLSLLNGVSPEAYFKDPRLQQIGELNSTNHEHFVGRTWELADLGSDFIGSRNGEEVKPLAIITGLGGMGKTALVAEALELWGDRFNWMLLFQSKPTSLAFEATFREIHHRLRGEMGTYHDHVNRHPADRIFREVEPEFDGMTRVDRLIRNLIRAMQHEGILLVLDNFEGNLKPQAEQTQGQALWACQDPAWDRCLKALATGLAGTRSRVLITSRLPLSTLSGDMAFAVQLGPLPPNEAALYLRAHPALSKMAMGNDEEKRSLSLRLLNASRFHPLLMDRLARLAADERLHLQLLHAIVTLEKTKDFAGLPDLFATTAHDAHERAYLDDALALSLDQFIGHLNADERRLLWVIALANDPVALGLLKRIWGATQLPPDSAGEELAPLLLSLVNIGLLTETKAAPDDHNPDLSCHELVRERIQTWMQQHPEDQGELTPQIIWLTYAQWLQGYYKVMQHEHLEAALEAGSRALIYCVQAQAWTQLEGFVSSLVTSTRDRHVVDVLIPYLQIAVESVQDDHLRLSFMCGLADALTTAGQLEAAEAIYQQASKLAHALTEVEEGDTQLAWATLAVIYCNWAIVYSSQGDIDAARHCYLQSNEAEHKAGSPKINAVINELEILRLDIKQGDSEAVAPAVSAHLTQVCQWWQRHTQQEDVPEAPDVEILARVVIGAFKIAMQVDQLKEDWPEALEKIDAALGIERNLARAPVDIGATRFDRANILMELPGRLDEARDELEACHELFQDQPNLKAKILSSLASLAEKQGNLPLAIDQARRALVFHEHSPNPVGRAGSHNDLASYLTMRGLPADLAEQRQHRLASLIYSVVIQSGQLLQDVIDNCAVDYRRASNSGRAYSLPRVAELLGNPTFSPLRQWLDHHQVDPADQQEKVDIVLNHLKTVLREQGLSNV